MAKKTKKQVEPRYCKDCKHFDNTWTLCKAPELGNGLVSGNPIRRNAYDCRYDRGLGYDDLCGRLGRWFQPKDKENKHDKEQ